MFYKMSQFYATKYCSEDISRIEGFMVAMRDTNQFYSCHHRLETHDGDGNKRLVNLTVSELKALGMYFNRPASELVFLSRKEHARLHSSQFGKSRVKSAEEREKISRHLALTRKAKYWASYGFKGKTHSEKTRNIISSKLQGIPKTEEHKVKQREYHWYNNGSISVKAKECPPGFKPGRITKWQ